MKNQKLLFILITAIVVIFLGIIYITNYPVSYTVVRESCDMDGDYDCDDDDFIMFKNVLGECIDGNYNRLADADHDGCITLEDQRILFPTKSE